MSISAITKRITLVCLVLVFVECAAMPAVAQSSGALAQGFTADGSKGAIVAGALVSFKVGDAHSVELASSDSADRIAGVVDNDPLVVISSSNSEVQVVLSGTTNVLVSDINGPINANDKITASPIAGVGMAASADGRVVGTALASFDTGQAQAQTITDSHGKEHSVHVGYVPLQVGVAYYQAPGSNFLPPFIQSLANTIAGRPVSLIRVILCGFLLLVGFITVAALVYSAVRSAMLSLGRNPLAAKDIRKGLFQVAGVSLAILGGVLLANFIILRV